MQSKPPVICLSSWGGLPGVFLMVFLKNNLKITFKLECLGKN